MFDGTAHGLGRLRAFGPVLGVIAALVALAGVDALRRQARLEASRTQRRAAVRALGYADLALSSAERWLRHPSLAEPGAARQDLPGALDVDPAGGLIGPPRGRPSPIRRSSEERTTEVRP